MRIPMLNRLLNRNRRQATGAEQRIAAESSPLSAHAGDMLVLHDADPQYDDPYLIVELVHRYTGAGSEWKEIIAANSQRRVWVECSESEEGIFITVADNRRPFSLEEIGVSEPDLITLDEEHSRNNGVIIQGKRYSYRNSFEAFQHPDGRPDEPHGFYLWDFIADDGTETLAVTKDESTPFEAYFSRAIKPGELILYPGERAPGR